MLGQRPIIPILPDDWGMLADGIKKVNTTFYPQSDDSLVERFNWTLLDMLAQTVKPGTDCDECLLCVFFCLQGHHSGIC